ncbi:hypothetical protein [Litorimonas sp. WD9-15]|uniref:hypothetical protein n=1 Tax=Litorimonas sp. WD9-15 TaxID=3418716 RepID=UPI003CFC2133
MSRNILMAACDEVLSTLIADLDTAPTSKNLLGLGLISDLLVLDLSDTSLDKYRKRLGLAAHHWIESGLMEQMLMASAQNVYHVSLMMYLAHRQQSLKPETIDFLETGLRAGTIGRGEIPLLTLEATGLNFRGFGLDFWSQGQFAELEREKIDKRLLRARMDEYDVTGCFMIARLFLSNSDPAARKQAWNFPKIMLVQSLRNKDLNWTAALNYINVRAFPNSAKLTALSIPWTVQTYDPEKGLLPLPLEGRKQSQYSENTPLGIRLRSSLALLATWTPKS